MNDEQAMPYWHAGIKENEMKKTIPINKESVTPSTILEEIDE